MDTDGELVLEEDGKTLCTDASRGSSQRVRNAEFGSDIGPFFKFNGVWASDEDEVVDGIAELRW